jgi:PAS domain S-box-containing protein
VSTELDQLFDRSPIGMYRSTEDGRFLYANPALARLLGYSVAELLALDIARDIYVDPAQRTEMIARHRASRSIDGAEVRWRTRDGRALAVKIYCHMIETPDGARFDVSVLDVTELEAKREALERTAKILDMVVRQVPAIYWRIDTDLRIIETGGAIEEVLGYGADRYVGSTLVEHSTVEPTSIGAAERHARALQGETVSFDSEYRAKLLAATISPVRSAAGEITGAIGTAVDVTRVRQLERRMVDAQRAESLGVLAGGLAHDFNNLLVAVIGNADLALREIPRGSPGRAAIENIRDAGLRAAELTDQLLAYAGHGGAGSNRVQLAPIVEELLRITAPSISPAIKLAIELPNDLYVRADPTQLRQVLLNLVGNARDALAAVPNGGSISIVAGEVQHDGQPDRDDILPAPAGAYVLLEVADNGPGMDAETRRHVFEPFFTTKQTGHGLGLAAVLGIVRAHGGGLRLVTSPGAGAKMRVLWPAAPTAPAHTPSPTATTTHTVLVVDDEDLVRDVVARMIEDLGYAAVTAADGTTALDLVARQTVDAVLVDLTMPSMNGAELITELRARRPDLPIALCTGFDRDGRGPVKADAYLPKPFRIDALEQTLAKLLRSR